MWQRQIKKSITIANVLVVLVTAPVFAQSSSSGSYRVDEYQFGSGGNSNLSSASYNANVALGSLGVGRSSSTNYDLEAGLITPNEPFLELFINSATVDLGTLDPSTTGYGNGVFWVRTYLSSAYTVQTMSQPPTYSGRTLAAKSTLGTPSAGTEEFGINLVDNATPDLGSNPFNVPDGTFADGQAATGYSTSNQFKYGVGDIIARSQATAGNQAVGRTDYTITYMANVSAVTPAGVYTMVHDIVAVATF